MQVNESIYGLKENWTPRNILSGGYPVDYPENEKLKLANFLNLSITVSDDQRKGCVLGSAIYQTEIYEPSFDIGRPVPDRSVCFTGMSGYSPYCKIKLISTRTDHTDSEPYSVTDEAVQTYNIFNFCYSNVTGASYGAQQKYWGFAKTSQYTEYDSFPTVPLYDVKWSPEPIRIGTKSNSYPYYYNQYSSRNQITFVTQLPIKHIVLIPFIKARTALNNNQIQVDLKNYLDNYKLSHPQILEITLKTYASHTDTGFALSHSQLNINNFNVIDALSDYYAKIEAGSVLCEKQINLVIPYQPTQGIRIGGCITGEEIESYTNVASVSWNRNLCIYAYIDCVDLEWNTFSGDGEPNINNHLICNADNYTVDQIRESVYKATACFGLFFTEDSSAVGNMYLDSKNMYLGVLEDGVGYGQYTHGVNNRNQPQWNWDDLSESPYDPDSPPGVDPNTYDTPSTLSTPTICYSGVRYYVLNGAAITNLVGELWKAQDSIPPDTSYQDYNNEQYLSNNPLDMIVSAKRYPLAPATTGEPEKIVLGQFETNVYGSQLLSTNTWLYLGYKLIYPKFRNYLDYETKIVLYIPFCGCIDLDSSVFMGDGVHVYMSIDYITGAVTAYIIRDSDRVIWATAEGNCSVDLPVTGLQGATIEAQLLRSKSSLDSSKLMIGAKIIGGITAFGVAAASGGTGAAAAPAIVGGVTTIASTISDGYKINQLNYDLHHTEAAAQQIGSSSPLTAWSGELQCRLYLYYPDIDPTYNPPGYAHSIGYAIVRQGTIGSFGSEGQYAQFTNVDLSGVPCTDSEKNMILTALTSGVYL